MSTQSVPNINILSFKQEESQINKFLNWSLHYGRIIIIVTEFIVIGAFLSRFYFDRVLSDVKDQIDNKTTIIGQYQKVEKDFAQFQNMVNQANTLLDTKKDYSLALQNFLILKPQDVLIRDIVIKDANLTFTAQTGTLQSFNSFIQNISDTKKFANVSIDDIAIKEGRLLITATATVQKEGFLP